MSNHIGLRKSYAAELTDGRTAEIEISISTDELTAEEREKVMREIGASARDFYLSFGRMTEPEAKKEAAVKVCILSEQESEEMKKAAQEAPPVTYTKEFVLFPDDEEKTVVISQIPSGATLKLDKRHAQLLADILIHQIQTW